ncbi:MAG: hypothetical protein WB647_14090, partial [Roseiarcus sp.]|uniref:hypothetical protein n=1 Tax=Roseiarcus sp. TaxID=1969460 RepID=UPI003C42FF3F
MSIAAAAQRVKWSEGDACVPADSGLFRARPYILPWTRRPALIVTRKLAAILVADIVGFSRLAGADEDR